MTARNHRIRLMGNNFADGYATVTSSSAHASYPLVNATHAHRSKLFKFAGNFTVTATKNLVYVNDGSNKTATIPAASYTGATLATALQTALNAVSSSWTVSYSSSTYRFTIAHTGSATLRLSSTTTSAWDLLGYVGASDRVGTSWVADEVRIHTEEWIKVDMGLAMEVGFLGVVGRLGETFPVSAAATVKLQANSLDLWTAPTMNVTVTPHDRGLMAFADQADETVSARVFRYAYFYVQDRTNPLGPSDFCPVGYFYIGDYETLTASNIGPGFRPKRVDQSVTFKSEAGVRFARLKKSYRTWEGLDVKLALAAERRRFEAFYERVGMTTPFFASLDPTLAISTALPEMTAYVYFAGDLDPEQVKLDRMNFSFDLEEAI